MTSHVYNTIRKSRTVENCNIAIPKSPLPQRFNSLVDRKTTVILEKELESMTSALPIDNGDFASLDVGLDMTP